MALVIVFPVISNSHLYGDIPPNLAFFYMNKKKNRDLLLVLELDAVLGKMQNMLLSQCMFCKFLISKLHND